MTDTLLTAEELLSGPVTQEEGEALIRALITTAPEIIPVEVLDTPGAPEAAIVWALGAAEAQRSADRALYARSAFRSTASRAWLGVVALENFGVTPGAADYATTNLTLANSSGALYGPFTAGTLRTVNDDTDAVYTNLEEVTIPILGSVIAGFVAIEPGSGSNAAIGEISRLETPLEGVTVSNAQPALGRDEESALSLNARIDARLGTFGVPGATGFSTGGTASAFEALARSGVDNGGGVPREDGSRITVTRTQLVLDILDGSLTLYVADDDGPIATGDLTTVDTLVQAYAEWIGAQVDVANTVAVPVTVSGALTIRGASATDAQILAAIDDELVITSTGCPIGGFPPSNGAPLRYVENAVESAGDTGKITAFRLVDIVLSSPSGATALAAGEVLVLSQGTITITRV